MAACQWKSAPWHSDGADYASVHVGSCLEGPQSHICILYVCIEGAQSATDVRSHFYMEWAYPELERS